MTMATVNPKNIVAIADALRSLGTSDPATTAPTPKKVPWLNAVMMRASKSTP